MAMNPNDLKLANGERQPKIQARKSGRSIAHAVRDDQGRVTNVMRAPSFKHQELAAALAHLVLKPVKA